MKRYLRAYTYTGDPDPSGRLEGDIRFLNRLRSWEDVYNELQKIEDKYFPDDDLVIEKIEQFFSYYNQYSNTPEWRYFEEAYDRWRGFIVD